MKVRAFLSIIILFVANSTIAAGYELIGQLDKVGQAQYQQAVQVVLAKLPPSIQASVQNLKIEFEGIIEKDSSKKIIASLLILEAKIHADNMKRLMQYILEASTKDANSNSKNDSIENIRATVSTDSLIDFLELFSSPTYLGLEGYGIPSRKSPINTNIYIDGQLSVTTDLREQVTSEDFGIDEQDIASRKVNREIISELKAKLINVLAKKEE